MSTNMSATIPTPPAPALVTRCYGELLARHRTPIDTLRWGELLARNRAAMLAGCGIEAELSETGDDISAAASGLARMRAVVDSVETLVEAARAAREAIHAKARDAHADALLRAEPGASPPEMAQDHHVALLDAALAAFVAVDRTEGSCTSQLGLSESEAA